LLELVDWRLACWLALADWRLACWDCQLPLLAAPL
jgi:hypothetical protein